jgi:putative NADH-flavin reductase
MRITVFGATGRTGRPLVARALDRGHEVVAFARSAAKVDREDPDLGVVEGDAYTGEGVAEAVAGADAVVSVLGQTNEGPDDLLTMAGENVLDAMDEAGDDRFVTLVGAGVRQEGESVTLSDRVMGALLKLLARQVLEDARTHVEQVRATDLDWTVVRAPRLTDDEGIGEYRAGDIDLGFESVARADVATFVLDCLEGEQYVHEMPKIGPASGD